MVNGPQQDLSTPTGFLLALKQTLRLKPGSLLFGGVPCSSMPGYVYNPFLIPRYGRPTMGLLEISHSHAIPLVVFPNILICIYIYMFMGFPIYYHKSTSNIQGGFGYHLRLQNARWTIS